MIDVHRRIRSESQGPLGNMYYSVIDVKPPVAPMDPHVIVVGSQILSDRMFSARFQRGTTEDASPRSYVF